MIIILLLVALILSIRLELLVLILRCRLKLLWRRWHIVLGLEVLLRLWVPLLRLLVLVATTIVISLGIKTATIVRLIKSLLSLRLKTLGLILWLKLLPGCTLLRRSLLLWNKRLSARSIHLTLRFELSHIRIKTLRLGVWLN